MGIHEKWGSATLLVKKVAETDEVRQKRNFGKVAEPYQWGSATLLG